MFTNPLLREIALILALKLLLLWGLWWAFVREARVEADSARVETLLLGAPSQAEPRP